MAYVIVNGSVFPISNDESGCTVVSNSTGELLHHEDCDGNVTIFSDPKGGSSTVVPIDFNINLYEERPSTGGTISVSTVSRSNSGVGVSSRRNSEASRPCSGSFDSYMDISRRPIIPDVLSITSRSRRNSRDDLIEAEAKLVELNTASDCESDSDNEDDYYD